MSFRLLQRAESHVNEHSDLEHLSGIPISIRTWAVRVAGSIFLDRHRSRAHEIPALDMRLKSRSRAAADSHGREILFVNLSDDPDRRQIGDPHQLLVGFNHFFLDLRYGPSDCARVRCGDSKLPELICEVEFSASIRCVDNPQQH